MKFFKRKDNPIKTYDHFWAWFAQHQEEFFNVVKEHKDIESKFFDKLSSKLAELKEGFWYLAGMFDESTVELILTADGEIKNIVFVEELVAAASKISGWRFTALKPALNIENVSINMDGYVFDSDTLTFYQNEDPQYPDEIDITIVHRDFNDKDKPSIVSGVYLFLDNYLGELNSVTTIDSVLVIGKDSAERELMPIEKLKSYLLWREKEFVERYHGVIRDTHDMEHWILKATTKEGSTLIAAINTELLSWESKASHPWILSIGVPYDGSKNGGLPEEDVNQALWKLEERI